jgi:hypothetical protein
MIQLNQFCATNNRLCTCISTVVDDAVSSGKSEPGADSLPADLLKYVEEDNEKFEAEVLAWDIEQRKKSSRAVATTDTVTGENKLTCGNYGHCLCNL